MSSSSSSSSSGGSRGGKNVGIVIQVQPESHCPLLVSFPIGVPPGCEEMTLEATQKTKGKKRRRNVVVHTGNGINLTGKDYGDELDKSKNVNQFAIIAVEGQRAFLCQTDNAFTLRPDLTKQDKDKAPQRLTALTKLEARNLRSDEFATAQKKRRLQVQASNIISAENISGASAVESAVQKTLTEGNDSNEQVNETLLAMNENRKQYLPPFDLEATKPKDIYPLSEMISVNLDNALNGHYESLSDAALDALGQRGKTNDVEVHRLAGSFVSLLTQESSSTCVVESLQKFTVASGDDRKADLRKLKKAGKLLVLLHYMVRFHNASRPQDKNKVSEAAVMASTQNAPDVVAQYLNNTFRTQKKGFSKVDRERLKVHIIAVMLHLNDFSVDLVMLARDLLISEKILVTLAREMGCKIGRTSAEKPYVATLVAPLVFPALSKNLRNKK